MDGFGEGNASAAAPRRGMEWTGLPNVSVSSVGALSLGQGEVWTTNETCTKYELVLDAGLYRIEAWGAVGGYSSDAIRSEGGYSVGELILRAPTKIFVVAGGIGANGNRNPRIIQGGCNGGGNGQTSAFSYYVSGGGGASHVAAVVDSLQHRILVAGGSGGSFQSSMHSNKGGRGGGTNGEDGSSSGSVATSNPGRGGSQIAGGIQCAYGSGCTSGRFGTGGSRNGEPGCGGGGGWFGGASSVSDLDLNGGGGGGSGFVFEGRRGTGCTQIDNHPLIGVIEPLKNGRTQVGGNSGEGRVTITNIELFLPTAVPTPVPTAKFSDPNNDVRPKFLMLLINVCTF